VVAVFSVGLMAPPVAAAPIDPPRIDVSGPRLPADGARGLGVESARLQPGFEGRFTAFALGKPLVWIGEDGERVEALSTVAGASGSMAATLGPVRAALSLPVFTALAGDDRPVGGAVGDPGLDLKARLLDREALALAAIGRGTVPAGAAAQAVGSDGPTGELGLAAAVGAGPWGGAAQLGYRLLPRVAGGEDDLHDDVYDDRLRLNLGLSWAGTGEAAPALSLELLSERQLNEVGVSWRGSPAELLLGGQWSPRGAAGPRLRGGLGAGLSPGVGAPVWRLMLGLGARAPLPAVPTVPTIGQPNP
jgi:hypothetical protein